MDELLVHILGIHAGRDHLPDGVDDLVPAAVVEGDIQDQPLVVLGELDGVTHLRLQ